MAALCCLRTTLQAAAHGASRRLPALDSKVQLLAAEVDRLDGQAATAVQALVRGGGALLARQQGDTAKQPAASVCVCVCV